MTVFLNMTGFLVAEVKNLVVGIIAFKKVIYNQDILKFCLQGVPRNMIVDE